MWVDGRVGVWAGVCGYGGMGGGGGGGHLIGVVARAGELAGVGEVAAHQVCQLLSLPLPAIPAPRLSPGRSVCNS